MRRLYLLFALATAWLWLTSCSRVLNLEPKRDELDILVEAASNGEHDKVTALLKTGMLVKRIGRLDNKLAATPLHAAAAAGQTEIVRLLLDSGLPVDFKDDRGRTPLYYAVGKRQRDTARLLLERKANPNAKHANQALLSMAASEGDLEMIKLLLDHKADIDGISNSTTPLYFAAAGGHEEAVKLLLKRGAKVKMWITYQAIEDTQPKTAKLLRNHFCRREMPQPIGIASLDQASYGVRKMAGCVR